MNITTLQNTNSYFLKDQLHDILDILADTGLILYPTDTIWGIGCDACNPVAIERVYNLKRRSSQTKPFVLLVDSIEMLKEYVTSVHPRIETLLSLHCRPLTIIHNTGKKLPPNALDHSGSVAVRVVQDEFCRELIKAFGRPIIAAHANIYGEPFPANFGEISSEIIQGVDYVAYHRREEKKLGEPSVIVKYDKKGDLVFLRE